MEFFFWFTGWRRRERERYVLRFSTVQNSLIYLRLLFTNGRHTSCEHLSQGQWMDLCSQLAFVKPAHIHTPCFASRSMRMAHQVPWWSKGLLGTVSPDVSACLALLQLPGACMGMERSTEWNLAAIPRWMALYFFTALANAASRFMVSGEICSHMEGVCSRVSLKATLRSTATESDAWPSLVAKEDLQRAPLRTLLVGGLKDRESWWLYTWSHEGCAHAWV